LENFSIVLTEPRYPGNVGAVARAMSNMGFQDLLLVSPCSTDQPESRMMAVEAWTILEKARIFNSLREALSGFQYAVATTRRGGRLRENALDPRSMARRLVDFVPRNRVALVFGPEDRGLNNEELCLCQAVVTIPTNPDFPSLNLSQAVMIILWELAAAAAEPPEDSEVPVLAPLGRVENMYRHMEEVLLEIGYLHPENPRRMIRSIKRVLNRAGLEERDIRAMRGIFRQFDWYFKKNLTKGESSD
jgi:tRNA/rRNA methyltransferase